MLNSDYCENKIEIKVRRELEISVRLLVLGTKRVCVSIILSIIILNDVSLIFKFSKSLEPINNFFFSRILFFVVWSHLFSVKPKGFNFCPCYK